MAGLEPSQWADEHRRVARCEPEIRLVLAVFEDAIRLLEHGPAYATAGKWARREWADAMAWLKDDSVTPFSLAWCCDVLGWDAEAVRVRLRRWHGHLPRRWSIYPGRIDRLRLPRSRQRRA